MASTRNSAARMKLLLENYAEARMEGPASGYQIRVVEPDNYEHFYILIKPIAGVYKGQHFIMEMKTSYGHGDDKTTYPINAPYAHFITNIFHVNISPNGGSICLDILKEKDKWSPLNSFSTIVNNILLLFNEPNNASPYNGGASKSWVECEKDYKSKKKGSMSIAELDELYLECFRPFIHESMRVMRTNNYKHFGKWFPELDRDHEEYDARVLTEIEEQKQLENVYNKIMAKRKAKESKEVKSDKKESPEKTKSESSDEKAKSEKPDEKAKKAKPRWAKYQT